MRKFWGFYDNGKYKVGCNGATVYVYDSDENEIVKFKDFPSAYTGAFMPGKNIIAVKSTIGCLGFYDLDKLKLVKKHIITHIGGQDGGFTFSKDGKYFYNIESPVTTLRTEIGVYKTTDFSKDYTLNFDEKLFLRDIELASEDNKFYVYGFMRGDNGILSKYVVGIFDEEKLEIDNIKTITTADGDYLSAYRNWRHSGFTDKCYPKIYCKKYGDLDKDKLFTIKDIYNKY